MKQGYNPLKGKLVSIKIGGKVIYSGNVITDSETKQIARESLTNLKNN